MTEGTADQRDHASRDGFGSANGKRRLSGVPEQDGAELALRRVMAHSVADAAEAGGRECFGPDLRHRVVRLPGPNL